MHGPPVEVVLASLQRRNDRCSTLPGMEVTVAKAIVGAHGAQRNAGWHPERRTRFEPPAQVVMADRFTSSGRFGRSCEVPNCFQTDEGFEDARKWAGAKGDCCGWSNVRYAGFADAADRIGIA